MTERLNIPFYRWTTVYFPEERHLVVSSSGLLGIRHTVYLHTGACLNINFEFSSKYIFKFIRNYETAFQSGHSALLSYRVIQQFHMLCNIATTWYCQFHLAILIDTQWYPTVVLICISLVSYAEHPSTCLFVIHIFFSEVFVQILADFLNSLCSLDTSSWSDVWFANIFSQLQTVFSILLIVSFTKQNLNFSETNLSIFFNDLCYGSFSKNTISNPGNKVFLLCFPIKYFQFYVLHLMSDSF